jgi:hypothetical protein
LSDKTVNNISLMRFIENEVLSVELAMCLMQSVVAVATFLGFSVLIPCGFRGRCMGMTLSQTSQSQTGIIHSTPALSSEGEVGKKNLPGTQARSLLEILRVAKILRAMK